MTYDPTAVTEHDRSFSQKMMWLGLPFSVALFAATQFGFVDLFATVFGGFVCGTFIGLFWTSYHDEFFQIQIAFASNWALGFAGIALFYHIIPYARDYPFELTETLAAMALVFHCALTYRRMRDGALSGGEE